MGNHKIRQSIFLGLLVVASTSFVPNLPILRTTSQVLAQSNAQKEAEAGRLLNQGLQQTQAGQLKAALISWEQALRLYRQINDRAGESLTMLNLGLNYHSLGDYQKAIEFHQFSLVIFEQIGNRKYIGRGLGNLALTYHSLGDYKKSIAFSQQHLLIARQIDDKVGEIVALSNLGNAYNSLGNYQKAIEFYQQHLIIANQVGDRTSENIALNNLGLTYHSLGDYQKATNLLQQAAFIAKQIGDSVGYAKALGNLGNTYYDLADYTKAIGFQQQSLLIFQQIGDRAGVAKTLSGIGIAYNSLGDYKKAIDFQQQSLEIAKQIGHRESIGQALGNLGNTYYSLSDYKKAIDFHQQRLVIVKQISARADEGLTLTNLGVIYYDLGDYKKAIDLHQQALTITKKIGNLRGEGSTLNNLGTALFDSGKLAEAEKILKQAIEVWKSQRGKLSSQDNFKISIFERQARTYRTLQKVLIAQNKIDEALEVSESGRARAFIDLLVNRLSPNKDISSATEVNINQIKQIAKQQNATLVQYSLIYDEFKIAEKREGKESEIYIWVIKPTGEINFRRTDLKTLWQKENITLNDLVTTSRESIGVRGTAFRGGIDVSYNPDVPKANNRLKRLHELLINPIADLLPKNSSDRVVFIPQSSLFLVPFPALQGKDGKYLIEKHTILTSPSIQVLDLTRKQKQRIGNKPIQGNNMLIVGNPTMPSIAPKIGEPPQQLKPLPGAEQEAKAIANLFKTQSLIGNQATETEITQRLSQAQFIHLATHGLFDDIQGLNSSIALAPGSTRNQKSDGLLTAEEILNLKLNAELVVLSACDTGRGKLTGDGVIGLSRAFISSGVPSVLVSLWAVPDAPTAGLMTEFYQNLQKSPDKAQALRQAMLTTMKQNPNPRDWAAFTLIGEAQ